MAAKGESIGEIRKKITKTYELISASYHEAGHAIFGSLNFVKITSVYVFEDKKSKRIHGYTNNTLPILDSIEDAGLLSRLVYNEVALFCAGLVAEKHHFRTISGSEQVPNFITSGSSDDKLAINKLIMQYNLAPAGPKRYAYKRKVNRQVLRSLKEYWSDVALVAYYLFRHKRLTYQSLFRLLTTHSENKKFWKERFRLIEQIYDQGPLDEKLLRISLFA